MKQIPERDWKAFKCLREKALERFAQTALQDFRRILNNEDQTAFDRFREIQDSLRKHDKAAQKLFSNLRRSTALSDLYLLCEHGFIQKEELSTLSSATRECTEKASGRR